jgi:hypothetical protein
MATVTPTISNVSDDTVVFSWVLTSTDRDGAPITPVHDRNVGRCVQATGTWGGATWVMQGSMDGTNWSTITDPTDDDITGTSGSPLFEILEIPLYTRPWLSTAGSGASITVTLSARKNRSGRATG